MQPVRGHRVLTTILTILPVILGMSALSPPAAASVRRKGYVRRSTARRDWATERPRSCSQLDVGLRLTGPVLPNRDLIASYGPRPVSPIYMP